MAVLGTQATVESGVAPTQVRAGAQGFQPDIQGLRGVAVLLVVLYHAGVAFPGGYIGVDVFFVISGFVIVRSLREELTAEGTLDLRRFYTRRARRLLPAFAATSVLTLAGSLVLLDSMGEQQRAVRTGVAASLFSANLALFGGGNDYFGPSQDVNPFLHTWSLSLEEQFYFVLPVSILLLWRWGAARQARTGRSPAHFVASAIGVVAVVSFSASVVLTTVTMQIGPGSARAAAFYGTPFRLWEFAAGVLLALVPRFGARLASGPASFIAAGSVALLLGTSLVYRDATVFPGLTALPPVAATAGLIAVNPRCRWSRRALSVRPLTLVGDVSYGWYLLHWPAIVFASRLWSSRAAGAVAGVVSLALALVLYRTVEEPIRHNRSIRGWSVLALGAVCVVMPVIVAAGVGYVAVSGRGASPPAGRDDDALPLARQHDCIIESLTSGGSWDRSSCLFNADGDKGMVLLLGDSHAASFSDAVVGAGALQGRPVAIWARASCPFVGRAAVGYERCLQWQADAFDLIDELRPEVVVIANRSPAYVMPAVGTESPLGPIALADGTAPPNRDAALDSWEQGLSETIRAIVDRGIAVVMVSTVPEYPAGTFVNATLWRPDPVPPTMELDDLEERRWSVLEREARAVGEGGRVTMFDPASVLCGDVCRAADGDLWLYTDNHHINRFGGERLVPAFAAALTTAVLAGS